MWKESPRTRGGGGRPSQAFLFSTIANVLPHPQNQGRLLVHGEQWGFDTFHNQAVC
jgi:hypothetical protein